MANIRELSRLHGRAVFEVAYNPTGKRGGKRVTKRFPTRDEAIAYIETLPPDKQACRGPASVSQRIDRLTEVDGNGCWIWQGRINPKTGYGVITMRTGGEQWTGSAHRISYATHVGAIPAGLQIDHLCRVRACCNPAHLEPVTSAENNRRAREAVPPDGEGCGGDVMIRAAQIRVLAEYRKQRGSREPYEAMRSIADLHAHAYAFGAVIGLPADHASQLTDLAEFEVADLYAKQIWQRGYGATQATPNARFWIVGASAAVSA